MFYYRISPQRIINVVVFAGLLFLSYVSLSAVFWGAILRVISFSANPHQISNLLMPTEGWLKSLQLPRGNQNITESLSSLSSHEPAVS